MSDEKLGYWDDILIVGSVINVNGAKYIVLNKNGYEGIFFGWNTDTLSAITQSIHIRHLNFHAELFIQ